MAIKHERLSRTIGRAVNGIEDFLLMIRKYLLTGVLVLVPLAVTIYIMFFVFQVTDGLLGKAVASVIGYRVPGMGIFLTALICVVSGMITQNYFGRRLLSGIESSLGRIPVVRSLYNGTKQVADVIVQKNKGEFKRVVIIEYPKSDCWAIAFLTADFTIPLKSKRIDDLKMVTVFLPTTPNPTSGYLLIIEKSRVIDTNLDIEEAMKVVISGGLVQPGGKLTGNDDAPAVLPAKESANSTLRE
ncbi:MAG: DUF502 domain-containing protein [Candidatus Rifleibacteriota bacterium]